MAASATPSAPRETPAEAPPAVQPIDDHLGFPDDLDPNTPSPKGGPEWWRRSFAYSFNFMSEPERAQFEAERNLKLQHDQHARCEAYRDYNLRHSPIVRFMSEQIRLVSAPTSGLDDNESGEEKHQHHHQPVPLDDRTIKCLPCPTMQSGGFSPHHGILLCQNRLLSKKHTEDTLAHEMVHMHDHLRFAVDWADIRHHACSEIRASSLSGECRWTREAFGRGVWDFTRQHQACVRRRATLSVRGHPKCQSDEHAARVVNQVFDSCFADTRPFDEIYR